MGETCDDGNLLGGDGCAADCHSNEACGNRVLDRLARIDGGLPEQCDDGNLTAGDGCSARCLLEVCGNSVVDPGELCDDGNKTSGDGCEPGCLSTGLCGNGVVDPGEQCDDANTVTTDGCPRCLLAVCGDGFVRAGVEQCDAKGETAQCNDDCTTARCGDGIVNPSRGEQCDVLGGDGGVLGGESVNCDRDCTQAFCGDGLVNSQRGETCDDGNSASCGTCSASCGVAQVRAAASGSIAAVSRTALLDGQYFVLSDGLHPAVTFEFDSNGTFFSGPDRVRIDISTPTDGGLGDASEVATSIIAAVASVGAMLGITASPGATQGTVSLLNTTIGGFGNQVIVSTVTAPGFNVSGMSGGSGSDCAPGVGCLSTDDCRPALTCQGTTFRVCQ